MPIDTAAAVSRLMRFLAVEGVTGREAAIGREIVAALKEVGVPARAIRLDDANTRIPAADPDRQPDRRPAGPRRARTTSRRLLFMTHMDTVPLCAGAKPKRQGQQDRQHARRRRSAATTAPAARVLVTLAAELAAQKLDHPPLTLLFTVREESGLWGARYRRSRPTSAAPAMGFNFDGRAASDVVVGAVGADRWEVEIFGRASHAGGAPERGISATMILGAGAGRGARRRLVRQGGEGQEAGHQQRRPGDGGRRPAGRRRHQRGHRLRAGARRKPQPRREVLQADHRRLQGRVREGREGGEEQRGQGQAASSSSCSTDYHPFRMKDDAPVVKRAAAAVAAAGLDAERAHHQRRARRQLDGAPRHPDRDLRRRPERGAHGRRVDRSDEYERACALAVRLATMGERD